MYFSATDQASLLGAIGETVTIDGTVTVTADFRLSGRLVTMADGSIETTGPICRFSAANVTNSGIDHGTEITARGVTYTVVELMQEETGFWLARLQRSDQLIAVDSNDDILLDDGSVVPSL